jgi:hypothetical protein
LESYVSTGFAGLSNNVIGTLVVPAGKVLKLESASFYRNAGSYRRTNNPLYSISIGDHVIIAKGSTTENINFLQNIIWLPSGTYSIIISTESSTAFEAGSTITINGIEFNVVP